MRHSCMLSEARAETYNSMVFTSDEKDKIDVLFKKFEDYCKPKQNIAVECYKFNTRLQDKSETIDQFVTALQLLAKECHFKELQDELILDRIVCGITSDRVKERHLRGCPSVYSQPTQPNSNFWYILVRRMYRICCHFGPNMLTRLGTYYVDKSYDPECSYNLYHKSLSFL